MSRDRVPPGIYEELITGALAQAMAECLEQGWCAGIEELKPHDTPEILVRHFGDHLRSALRAVPGEGADQVAKQVALTNRLLDFMGREFARYPVTPDDAVELEYAGEHTLVYVDAVLASDSPIQEV